MHSLSLQKISNSRCFCNREVQKDILYVLRELSKANMILLDLNNYIIIYYRKFIPAYDVCVELKR